MVRPHFVVVTALAVSTLCPPSAQPETVELAGRWILNRDLSQFPREIGFDAEFASTAGPAATPSSRGRRGDRRGTSAGGGTASFTASRESQEDAQRLQLLTGEVRNPSAHLTIAETEGAVTITDDRGQWRTFHPDGKEEQLHIGSVSVGVIARWEPGQLVVLYKVEQGRQLRYTYAHIPGSSQLVVEVQFVQRRGGDHVRRVYEPASATDATTIPPTAPASAKPAEGQSTGGVPSPGPRGVPAVGGGTSPQTFNQTPGAELRGLKQLGIVVEDLSPQAAACGLSQSAIEAAISMRLSDAGFSVRRNSDEDTYLYVNVITTNVSNGLCISRYDAFLYAHTTATLSYQREPVLVQVALLHKGGLVGGASSSHAEGVLRGLQDYVDQFSRQIRDANK